MNKRLLIALSLMFLLTGCGDSATSQPIVTPESSDVYATEIQKNNRTVRVKAQSEMLADMTLSVPTDEYVRNGFLYACYSLPEEILRFEYIRPDSLGWDEDVNPVLKDIFYHRMPGDEIRFLRYVMEDYFSDKPNATAVGLNVAGPYENMYRVSYHVDDVFYSGLLTQTAEDLEKGEDVYSLYIAIKSLPPK